MAGDAEVAVLLFISGVLLVYAILVTASWKEAERKLVANGVKLMAYRFSNPYAHLLGKTVEAKVYAASRWERMVVVAVSWRGAVCVRPERDMQTKGRWIPKHYVPERVREVMQ